MSLGDRLIAFIADVLKWIWHFSFDQLYMLFHHSWHALPPWKIVVLAVVVIVVALSLWSYVVEFAYRLLDLVYAVIYALAGVLVLGLIAFVTNWFISQVHIPALDKLVAFN